MVHGNETKTGGIRVDDLAEAQPTRQTRVKYLIPHEVLAKDSADRRKISYLLNRRFEEERCRIEILKIELAAARGLMKDLLDSTDPELVREGAPRFDVRRQAQLFIEYSLPRETRVRINKLQKEFQANWSNEYSPRNIEPYHTDCE